MSKPPTPYSWTLQMQGGLPVTLLIPGNPGILYDGQFGLYSLCLSVPDQTILNQFLVIQGIDTTWTGGPVPVDAVLTDP